jgi:hypothetical protein
VSDRLLLHRLPFKVGDLTLQRHGDEPRLFPIRARSRSRYEGQIGHNGGDQQAAQRQGSRNGRLKIEPRARWGLFFRCQGSYSGCGEDRHQPRGLPRAWNMRAFTVLNRAGYDGAKTPPANTKRAPAP